MRALLGFVMKSQRPVVWTDDGNYAIAWCVCSHDSRVNVGSH